MILKIINRNGSSTKITLKDNVRLAKRDIDSENNRVVISIDYKDGRQREIVPIENTVYVCDDRSKIIGVISHRIKNEEEM